MHIKPSMKTVEPLLWGEFFYSPFAQVGLFWTSIPVVLNSPILLIEWHVVTLLWETNDWCSVALYCQHSSVGHVVRCIFLHMFMYLVMHDIHPPMLSDNNWFPFLLYYRVLCIYFCINKWYSVCKVILLWLTEYEICKIKMQKRYESLYLMAYNELLR